MDKTSPEVEAGRESGPVEIGLPEMERLLTGGGNLFLVDVRTEDAFLRERIPGSLSVPRGVLEFLIEEVISEREAMLIIVCDDGSLSRKAVLTLRVLGYSSAYALQGGLFGWKRAGHPISRGNPAAGDAPLSWRWAHGEGSRLIRE
ncbi:MAG: hypothetical protein HYY65_13015 [Candidatus Tectomicrobia bacterium]|uniref:Rhodanese domain-containing protein n=1 Tax=Tectimicrobiota bacterium TaxID=2528274 RepID=A0A932GS57_UNCTE|nr:hypothetical protein [Candidatus Tectomicrobia bacterium]